MCVCLQWRPGRQQSEGQGVAVGNAGRADDQASVLGVCLQHLLGLLASHSEETAAAKRKGKPHLCYPPGAAGIKKTGAAARGGGFQLTQGHCLGFRSSPWAFWGGQRCWARVEGMAGVEVEGVGRAESASFPESELPAASTPDREAGGFYWESPSAGRKRGRVARPKHINHQQMR